MTFGQLVQVFKDDWVLEPQFEALLNGFVKERNTVIHRLTVLDGFVPRTKRARQRLERRLKAFVDVAFYINGFFRGARFSTYEFQSHWLKEHADVDIPFTAPKEHEHEVERFHILTKYKGTRNGT